MKKIACMMALLLAASVNCIAQSVTPDNMIERVLEGKLAQQALERSRQEQQKREVDLGQQVPENFQIQFKGIYNWMAPKKVEADGYVISLDTKYPEKDDSYKVQLSLGFELKENNKSFPKDKITFPIRSIGVGPVSVPNDDGFENLNRCAVIMRIENGNKATEYKLGLSLC